MSHQSHNFKPDACEDEELACPPLLHEKIGGRRGLLASRKPSTDGISSRLSAINQPGTEGPPDGNQQMIHDMQSRLQPNPHPMKHFVTMPEAQEYVNVNTT